MSATVGYIYIIGSMEHMMHVKVGLSRKQAHHRLSELQTGNPFMLHLWASFPVTRGSILKCEHMIHGSIKEFHYRGEWFKRHPRDMIDHVERLVCEYNKIKKR